MFKCANDRWISIVELGPVKFYESHILDKPCIGDPCKLAIHAEAALVAHLSGSEDISLYDRIAYTKELPCLYCAGLLITAGIKHLYIEDQEIKDEEVYELLAMRIALSFGKPPQMPEKQVFEVGPVSQGTLARNAPRSGSQRDSGDFKGGKRSANTTTARSAGYSRTVKKKTGAGRSASKRPRA